MNEETIPPTPESMAAAAAVADVIAAATPTPEIQKLIDTMPGLVGGLDCALIDHVGKPVPFVLVLFSGKTAVHATNFDASQAMTALKGFTDSLASQGE